MRFNLDSSFFLLVLALWTISFTEASTRVQWVRDQGFPYLLTYNEQNIVAKYCYGEVEDILSEKKIEILCRAMHDGKCPAVSDCYDKRAVNGVIQ
ncbi:MAG: hypothetical protein A2X86_18305 [Bdellovibrionales bacterium GWA2_49_15]|nr:MAG: hypothetical protein A2X86_18305 [Bdellovibrionales bacterium GWA2_49_15]HAZ11677.1 hypothetical protein [Bdellovibrionales bacterium]